MFVFISRFLAAPNAVLWDLGWETLHISNEALPPKMTTAVPLPAVTTYVLLCHIILPRVTWPCFTSFCLVLNFVNLLRLWWRNVNARSCFITHDRASVRTKCSHYVPFYRIRVRPRNLPDCEDYSFLAFYAVVRLSSFRRFEQSYCPHLHSLLVPPDTEDYGPTIFQNVGNYLPNDISHKSHLYTPTYVHRKLKLYINLDPSTCFGIKSP
jgi:hypothetical protein